MVNMNLEPIDCDCACSENFLFLGLREGRKGGMNDTSDDWTRLGYLGLYGPKEHDAKYGVSNVKHDIDRVSPHKDTNSE